MACEYYEITISAAYSFTPPNPAGPGGDTYLSPDGVTPTGENNMITVKRLVAAANNKIWYESVGEA